MTDIPFVVVYHSDQDSPTQADVDRAARFMAMTLHRSAGPRHAIFYDGKELIFDASDSGRWTNSIPAEWMEPAPIVCSFTWFNDDGVLQQCAQTADHPWDEGQQEVPHSAKGITPTQAQRLLRKGVSSNDYQELAKRFDHEMTGEPAPLAKKAAKKAKAAGKKKPARIPNREVRAK